MIPALMVLLLALLAVGLMFFQVGRAAIFSTEAQTGGRRRRPRGGPGDQGRADRPGGDHRDVEPGGHRLRGRRRGRRALGAEEQDPRDPARSARRRREGRGRRPTPSSATRRDRVDSADDKGQAHARARIDVLALPAPGGGNIGSSGGNAVSRIKEGDWDDLEDKISKPPTCGNSAKSNDLVTLGKMLQEHGFNVAENAEMGSPPGARGPLRGRLPLQVPQLRRPRRQRRQRAGNREVDHRRDRRRRAEARLPHDLAGGRPLQPHPHRRRQLGADRRGRRRRRRGGRARGDRARRQADRLGGRVHAVRRARRPGLRRLLRRPARPGGGEDPLRRARRHQRVAEDPPGDVRDRDRRVRRAQPQLRRSRLRRRLPAARVDGLGRRLFGDGSRRARPGSSSAGPRPLGWPARAGRRGSCPRTSRTRGSRCATTRSRARRWRCWRSSAGTGARCASGSSWSRWRSRSAGAACSTTRVPRCPRRPIRPSMARVRRPRPRCRRFRSRGWSRRLRRSRVRSTAARSGSSTWRVRSGSSRGRSTPPRT